MRQSHRLITNSIASLTGTLIQLAVGFLIPPFVIAQVGKENFGLVATVIQVTNIVILIQVGTPHALNRFLAGELVRKNYGEARCILSTGLAILTVTGAFSAAAVFIISWSPDWFMNLPEGVSLDVVRAIVMIAGGVMVLGFPLSIGTVAFTVQERFALLNLIRVFGQVLRIVAVFLALYLFQGSLIAYVAATNGAILVQFGLGFAVGLYLLRNIPPSWTHVTLGAFKRICVYGLGCFVNSLAYVFYFSASVIVVNWMLGNAAVTQFDLASRWIIMVRTLMVQGVLVAVPAAAKKDALGDVDSVRFLLVRMTKYGLLFSVPSMVFFCFFRYRIMLTWIGPGLDEAASLMLLLALADFMSCSILVANPIASGIGKIRFFSVINAILGPLNVGLAILFIKVFHLGLVSVGLSLLIVFSIRAVLLTGYIRKHFDVKHMDYFLKSYLGPLVAGGLLIPAVFLLFLITPERGWFGLGLSVVVIGILYLPIVYLVAFDAYDRKVIKSMVHKTFSRVRGRGRSTREE